MKHFNKAVLLSLSLILLAACDGLQGIGLEPQIITFGASPDVLEAGESSTLSWNVVGGAEDLAVTLTPGDIDLDAMGDYNVIPSETTTYTLSASSEDKVATKQVTVTVNPGDEEPGETPNEPGEEPGENPDEPGEEPGETPDEPGDKVIEGDVMVTNQTELDALAGVTSIEGSLTISTEAETLDFSPLNSLKTITETLTLNENPKLADIKGFGSLVSVTNLSIIGNDSLKSFSGFAALELATLTIDSNPALETLPDFNNLTRAVNNFDGVKISNNPKLTALPSFSSLEEVGLLNIFNNESLTEVTGFDNALSFIGFGIDANSNLKTISGFSKVRSIGSGRTPFRISSNPELMEISGFDVLESGGAPFTNVSDNVSFDCSAAPQADLPFLPVRSSTGNLVNCPTAE